MIAMVLVGACNEDAADAAYATDSLREPLTKERYYFVMTDRFANGDPTNDTGGLTGDRRQRQWIVAAAREQHMQQHIRRVAARVAGCRRWLMELLTAFFIFQDLAPFQLVGVAGVSSSLPLHASV